MPRADRQKKPDNKSGAICRLFAKLVHWAAKTAFRKTCIRKDLH